MAFVLEDPTVQLDDHLTCWRTLPGLQLWWEQVFIYHCFYL